MSEIDNANKLFAEVGSYPPVLSVFFNESDLSWVFRLEGKVDATAALDPRTGLVTFEMGLGRPIDASADRVNRLLLQFSYLWRETGGFFAALDASQTPTMLFRCGLNSLEPGNAVGLLQGLLRQRAAWSEIITSDATGPDDAGIAMPTGGIRV